MNVYMGNIFFAFFHSNVRRSVNIIGSNLIDYFKTKNVNRYII